MRTIDKKAIRKSLGDKLDSEFLNTAAREISRKISMYEPGNREYAEEIVEAIFSACGKNGDLSASVLKHFIEELFEILVKQQPWLEKLHPSPPEMNASLANKTVEDQKVWLVTMVTALESRIQNYIFRKENETIRKICSYVLNHVDEELTVKEVAQRLNFNRDYLSRFFKEATGVPMTDYINRVKTDRARTLLETGNYKIYEISEMLGYKAVEHFSRLFRQYQGIYPKGVRKELS